MKRLAALLIPLLLLSACAPRMEAQTRELFAMDTVMTLTASGEKAAEALGAAADAINGADALWNMKSETSEIYHLNHAGGAKVTLSAETIDVLKKALYYAGLTGGAFDPTIAPVSLAWDISGDNPRIPSDTELASLLPLVGYQHLSAEGGQAWFLQSGMEVDLGGIGKGAISDTLMGIFKKYGVKTALFSLGGNVGAMGQKEGGGAYKIGIQDPDGTQNDILGYLTLTDKFVITSGDYERYFIQDGVRYFHIFDPATGKPARSGLREVSIVSDNGALGDAYSTALFVMGLQKGLAFQKAQGNFEAVFVTEDKKVITTGGLKGLFTFTGGAKGYTYED